MTALASIALTVFTSRPTPWPPWSCLVCIARATAGLAPFSQTAVPPPSAPRVSPPTPRSCVASRETRLLANDPSSPGGMLERDETINTRNNEKKAGRYIHVLVEIKFDKARVKLPCNEWMFCAQKPAALAMVYLPSRRVLQTKLLGLLLCLVLYFGPRPKYLQTFVSFCDFGLFSHAFFTNAVGFRFT